MASLNQNYLTFALGGITCRPTGASRTKQHPIKAGIIPRRGVCGCWCVWEQVSAANEWGSMVLESRSKHEV